MKFLLVGFLTWHLAIFTCAKAAVPGPFLVSKPDDLSNFISEDTDINESIDGTSDIVKNKQSTTSKQFATQMVASGERNFSTQFFKLMSPVKTNYVCSPLSIYMALSMASYGSREYTKTELSQVLGIPKTESNYVKKGYEEILADLTYHSDVTLSVSNKFLLNSPNRRIKKKYLSILHKHFIKPTENDNLDNNLITYQRIGVVNPWRQFLPISPTEVKIGHTEIGLKNVGNLTSQLIFNGAWARPFNPAATSDRLFHLNETYSQNISTMYTSGYFRYGKLSQVNATFVGLPYKNHDSFHAASMFVILPNDPNGLETLVKNIDKVSLHQLCDGSVKRKVRLYLPKFMTKSDSHIRNDLRKKMGLGDVLSIRSDFEGISEPGPEPGKVYHYAMMDVKEQGTGSFAKTTILNDISQAKIVSPINEDADSIVFDANYPFVTIIATTGHIRVNLLMSLFVGP